MKRVVILILLFGLSASFDNEAFLSKCNIIEECLECTNVLITAEDSFEFQANLFNITSESCVRFHKGDVGMVNNDFFKQFPSTTNITFENLNINLKSSEKIEEHEFIVEIVLVSSNVTGNHRTNAFHSLTNLKTFVLIDHILENPTIDKMLLEKNTKLQEIILMDSGPPKANKTLNTIKKIDEDVFNTFLDLKKVTILVEEMTEFPKGLPPSVIHLTVSFNNILHIGKDDFQNLTNLLSIVMSHSKLESIDKDTFEELETLEGIILPENNIQEFDVNLKNNKNLKIIDLVSNPIKEHLDFSELGFKVTEEGLFEKDN